MAEFRIATGRNEVKCLQFGSGNDLLICFHGFGEDSSKYLVLEPALSDHFTVVAVDLPFHGGTRWYEDDLFTKDNLRFLIHEILKMKNARRFSLMGYSLGGKLALVAVSEFASQIDLLILAAPDGVKNNVWYNVGVYPEWGQKLFHRFVENPSFIFVLAKMMKAAGLLSGRLYHFLKTQTDTYEKRKLVHDSWICLREIKINLEHTKELINRYDIQLAIFTGEFDRVITPKTGRKFSKGITDGKFIVLQKGHNLITESFNEPLKKFLDEVRKVPSGVKQSNV